MACDICKGTGWTGWEKPMGTVDGVIQMVFVPQHCPCSPPVQFVVKHEPKVEAADGPV